MKSEMLDVLDDEGKVIGKAPRSEVHTKGRIHRTVMFFLLDRHGRVFVNQRTENKDFYPGYWSIVLGGHVSSGQSYEDAVRREAEEEAGITTEPFFIASYKKRHDRQDREDVMVYGFVTDGKPRLDPGEIKSGSFMTMEETERKMQTEKFLPETANLLRMLKEWKSKV